MIISPGRQFIFVHIPKTGGTSMALALESRARKDDILIGDTPKAQKRKHRLEALTTSGRVWKHSTLQDIDGIVSAQDLETFFVFTLVRNPWDRMVSYYHWLRDQSFDHQAVHLAKSVAFEPFLRAPATVASLRATPASSYVTDKQGREYCNAYVRLEFLRPDLAPVEKHLGFRIDLKRANATERPRDYRSFYTDSLAEFLGEIFSEDVSRFHYSF